MSFFASVKLAISRIMANKSRSFLTMLGVIIGVAALVALTSVASGATSGITDALNGLGARQITITATANQALNEADFDAIKALPNTDNAYVQVNSQGNASFNDQDTTLSLVGVSDQYFTMAEPDLAVGTFLPNWPDAQRSREVVLSTQAANDLDISAQNIGNVIKLNGLPFTLVGVLDDSNGFGASGKAYITLDVARTMFAQYPYVGSITAQATTEDGVDALSSAIDSLLRARYGLDSGDTTRYTTTSLKSLLQTLGTIQNTISLLLGGIASLSLIVGGVGIMNIMLVSVRERTREIGVRRAIGAKQSQILTQFLIESIVLSVIGGLIGLGLGVFLSYAISKIGNWAFVTSPTVFAVALGFAALVGVIFGAWPARTAAKLAPVDALRFE